MSTGAPRPRIAAVADLYLASPPASSPRPEPLGRITPARIEHEPRVVNGKLPVSVVLASALGDRAADAVTEYARSRAVQGRRVALLTITPTGRDLRLFRHCDNGHSIEVHAGETGPEDLDGFAFTGILDLADQLVIAWLAGGSLISPALGRAAVHATVLTGGSEEQLVDAYRDLKLAASLWDHGAIGMFVVGAASRNQAGRLRDRLTNLAADFLGCGIRFDGCTVHEPARTSRLVAKSDTIAADRDAASPWLGRLYEFVTRHGVPDELNEPAHGIEDKNGDASHAVPIEVPTRMVLPLPSPLITVSQLDVCLSAHTATWAHGTCGSASLDSIRPAEIAVRRLIRSADCSSVVACALDPRAPILEAALCAADAIDDVFEIIVVGPKSDVGHGSGRLLRCPFRIFQFEQIQLHDHHGLLLTPRHEP
jgi:hypothetical protein